MTDDEGASLGTVSEGDKDDTDRELGGSVDEEERRLNCFRIVGNLKKRGTWVILKPQIPPMEPKCHWDYLLEEMKWMAHVFQEERKQRRAKRKTCTKELRQVIRNRCVELELVASEEENLRKERAHHTACLVKTFWNNVRSLIRYKFQTIVDFRRKEVLDDKLSKVLHKSETYALEIAKTLEQPLSQTGTDRHERRSDKRYNDDEDEDFDPEDMSASDNEDTIADEEAKSCSTAKEYKTEIEELENENNLSYEQVLAKYSGYFDDTASSLHLQNSDYERIDEDTEVKLSVKVKVVSNTFLPNHRTGSTRKKGSAESHHTERSSENVSRRNRVKDISSNNKLKEGHSVLSFPKDTSACSGDDPDYGLEQLFSQEYGDFYPSSCTLESTKVTTKIPYLLRHQLREYQHIGLDWLVSLYEKNLNGILADEMGLGKTIQTIALLAYLAVEKGNWGPHLIIVPSSLLLNWELELLKWCPGLKILTYYGSAAARKQLRSGWFTPNYFHVCITSYSVAVQDQACFRRRNWEYMILDEAHKIKSFKSQRWQVLLNFKTKRRLLITGTPLQNNVMELWSLLHFLMPQIFESRSEFGDWFFNPCRGSSNENSDLDASIVKQLHKVLRPFILRRMKADVEKQLPCKFEHIIRCPLSNRQRLLYEEFMIRADTKNTLQGGSFVSVLGVLMQLRKVCNHPDLFEPRPVVSPVLMEGVTFASPRIIWDSELWLKNKDFAQNLFGLDRPELEDDSVPEFIYSPSIPVRSLTISETGKTVVNLAIEHFDRPPQCPSFKYNPVPCRLLKNTLNGDESIVLFKDDAMIMTPTGMTSALEEEGAVKIKDQCKCLLSFSSELTEAHEYPLWALEKDSTTAIFSSTPCMLIDQESTFCNDSFDSDKRILDKIEVVDLLNSLNRWRCMLQCPSLIDESKIARCEIIGKISLSSAGKQNQNTFSTGRRESRTYRLGNGYAAIMTIVNIRMKNPNLTHHPTFLWSIPEVLDQIIISIECLVLLAAKLLRCIIYTPAITLDKHLDRNLYRPPTAILQHRRVHALDDLKRKLAKSFSGLHPIASAFSAIFPDPRLVQYDCGKLQVLDRLLRTLKSEGHKVLIFTQMSKMLNVLEVFLTFNGHTYLRMDGSTKIEQRQLNVERFNRDPKIFCFILSTRSGGLGLNLVGADTVIFYDSDWNPTMDAQAQDRCHRIGQTRDVHIYRLISENSVEENILKVTNRKRLLEKSTIEDGQFNTSYLHKISVRQIFSLSEDINAKFHNSNAMDSLKNQEQSFSDMECVKDDDLEDALAVAEDDVDDRRAFEAVMEEVEADRAEFEDTGTISGVERVKQEFQKMFSLLNPVEQYALCYLDAAIDDWSVEVVDRILTDELDKNRN